ncbi:hypothetical protein ACJ41O_010141 [Fusarium nematophilum]
MASSPPVLAQAVLIDSSATVVVLIINTITPLDISIPTRTTSVPDELHDDGHTLEVGLADLHGLGPARDIVTSGVWKGICALVLRTGIEPMSSFVLALIFAR